MARKKTITRDQILKAAYEVVATEGFTRFTARNIAAKMKCSTQPIYLEFKNMDDLKNALINQIYDLFVKSVKKEPKYQDLSDVKLQSLHTGVWIVATGLAALMSSGIIHPTEDQIAKLMTETTDNILARETPIDISYH